MMTEWLHLAILSSVVEGMGTNQLSVNFAELKEIQKLFLGHQFCIFRFSVLSLNLKNDENLESGQHRKNSNAVLQN
jgi:hypothetical protein